MATKLRIHQVAKEVNISNETLISFLTKLNRGYDIRGPMTALTEEMYEEVLKKYRKEPEVQQHSADFEFRKRLRDKKAEEEKERERVRHDLDERMRLTSKLAERRARQPHEAAELGAGAGKRVAAAPGMALKRDGRSKKVEEGVEVVARHEPEKPAAVPEAKAVPSIHDTVVALISKEKDEQRHKEERRPATPPAGEPAPAVAPPAPPAKKAAPAAAEEDGAKKKRKRKRRRKKKAVGVELEPEEVIAARLVKEKEKPGKKAKKRKKRKISDEEIDESIRQTLAAMEGGGKPRPDRKSVV